MILRPRLLVLTSTLPRWENDSEPRFILDLTTALSDRFDATILAPMAVGAATSEIINGIKIQRYRYALARRWECLASPGAILPNLRRSAWLWLLVPGFIIAQFVATVSLLKRQRFDVVHCHWLIPQGLIVALASLVTRVPPRIVTCHGADAFTLNGSAFRRLKGWIIKRHQAVTVVSREIGAKLADLNKANVPAVHIPMGVNIDLFSKPSRSEGPCPLILCAGRLAAKKGVQQLIEAVGSSRLRWRGLQIRIVGDGPLRESLTELSSRLGLNDKIVFTGAMPHELLAQQMHAATIFCAPYVVAPDGDREGTPTILLEAAAAGLPIITSDVGGCGDIVVNGKSGWLLSPGDTVALIDALEDALDQPVKAQQFGRGARELAQSYSWPSIADRHVAVLNQVLGS